MRPKEVHLTGYDLDGNEISVEADEFLARVFQHEVDHLDGVLLVERLDEDQRKEAKRILRTRALGLPDGDPDGLRDARRRRAARPAPRPVATRRRRWPAWSSWGHPRPRRSRSRRSCGAGHDMALVVSRADARRGRGATPHPSPVKRAALDLGLDVTDRLDDVAAVGRRARRRGGLRPHRPGPRPRRRCPW